MGVHPGYWGSEGQRRRVEDREFEKLMKDLSEEMSAKRWAYSWRRYTIRFNHHYYLYPYGKYIVQDWNQVAWEMAGGIKIKCEGSVHSRHDTWMSAALRCLLLDAKNVILSVPMALWAVLEFAYSCRRKN